MCVCVCVNVRKLRLASGEIKSYETIFYGGVSDEQVRPGTANFVHAGHRFKFGRPPLFVRREWRFRTPPFRITIVDTNGARSFSHVTRPRNVF